ncbi:MAG: hypothetical protein ABI175_17150 [Polyangiales bacterium]
MRLLTTSLMGLAGFVAAGCGSTSQDPNPVGGDAAADVTIVDASTEAGLPATVVYEVSYFRLGVSTRDGEEDPDAWKQYGFDLDGICTSELQSETSEGTCLREPKSKVNVLADGDHCIDNNFGSQLVPLVKVLGGDLEKNLVDGLAKGGATLVIQLRDLEQTGADPSVPGALFAGKSASGASLLDGTDVMDVDETSVVDHDLTKPIAVLDGKVEVIDGKRVWSARAETMSLPVVFIAGATGAIPVRDVRLEIDLETGRGTVGGYSLIADIATIVNALLAKNKICPGSIIYDSAQTNVGQGVDMPAALPHDPTAPCVSISLGIGFEVTKASLGKVYPTPPPPVDNCAKPDAGPPDVGPPDAAPTDVDPPDAGP